MEFKAVLIQGKNLNSSNCVSIYKMLLESLQDHGLFSLGMSQRVCPEGSRHLNKVKRLTIYIAIGHLMYTFQCET